MIELRLMGVPRYVHEGAQHNIAWQVPAALLVRLACQDEWMDRARLAEWLRPEVDAETSRAYLRRTLHRARQLIWGAALEIDPERVRLQLPSDCQALQAAYQARDWRTVIELYRGHFLEGAKSLESPAFDTWIESMRSRLRGQWRAAAFALAEDLDDGDAPSAAFDVLERIVDDDLLDEEALQMLLARAESAAQVAIATRRFEQFVARASDELGSEPLPATAALAAALRERTQHAPSAAAVARAPKRSTLPPELTPFVGRRKELGELSALLADPSRRLVSIVGLGGIGKTRLAAKAASEFERGARGDVWFAALDAAHDGVGMLYAIAAALGVRLSGEDAEATLTAILRDKTGLLVLDNLEHIPEAAALVGRLLEAAPGLRFLCTSRAPLRLVSEWPFALEGLALGPEGDALQLLEACARRHGCGLEAEDRDDAESVCSALQGSPLALELAGSFARVLSIRALAAEIGKSIGFLVATEQDRNRRHVSLESVFVSTWESLPPRQRALLPCLTVFEGGFDARAARAIADAEAADLFTLAGHSLLRRTSPGRFDVHPLIKEFSAARLEPARRETLARKHALFYIDWLTNDPMLPRGVFDARALESVEVDFGNIEAAWNWAIAQRETELLTGVLSNLDTVLVRRGRDLFGHRLYRAAVESAPAGSALRARFEVRLAGAADGLGRSAEARERYESAEPLLESPEDRIVLLNGLTVMLAARGENAAAADKSREAVALARRHALRSQEIHALQNLAVMESQLGNAAAAETHLAASLALSEDHNLPYYLASARFRLGHVRWVQHRLAEARELLELALIQFRRFGDRYYEAYTLVTLSEVKTGLGETEAGLEDASAAVRLGDQLGILLRLPMFIATAAWAEIACGRRNEARVSLKRAMELGVRHGTVPAQLRVIAAAAAILPASRREDALRWLGSVEKHPSFRADYRREIDTACAMQAFAPGDLAGIPRADDEAMAQIQAEVRGWLAAA